MADVELELRRLGGIDGMLNLFRRPLGRESNGAYADRIEFGTALLSCSIKHYSSKGRSGATRFSGPNTKAAHEESMKSRAVQTADGPTVVMAHEWKSKALALITGALEGVASMLERAFL